ncbi:MAG: hypothetical protein KDE55_06245 [Novosphingobium sp.]|nr:hypothetical protein [Novosphingobium sp.]
MAKDRFYGYDYRMGQPYLRLGQRISPGSIRDTGNIDTWLTEHFGLKPDTIADGTANRADPEIAIVARLLRRMLALYGEFMTASGIPCYDPGRILHIEADSDAPGAFAATVALQALDFVPPAHFVGAFEKARDLVLTRLTEPPSREVAEPLLEDLKDNFIDRLQAATPFKREDRQFLDVAYRAGVPYRHLGGGVLRFGWGARSKLMRYASSEEDSFIAARICGGKDLTARFLRIAGLPGAENTLVRSAEQAVAAANEYGYPVVVKPADRERSEGVTAGIRDEAALLAAYEAATKVSENILVERHAEGLCNRIMVVSGKLIYAVTRIPKSLVGNGTDTIEQLAETANRERMKKPPWDRFKVWPLDEMSDACLADQGLDCQSVPADGQRVLLRNITSDQWGGDVNNVTAQVHPDNARLAIDAARAVGLSIAGIDLMTTDISKPWHETGAIINEVNFTPQFSWIYREAEATQAIPALMHGDGRIPVHLVTGSGDILARARAVRDRLASEGHACHLTSADRTEAPDGKVIAMPLSTLFDRTLALVMRKDVQEMILVGAAADFAGTGLAVDRLENIYLVESDRERAEKAFRALDMRYPAKNRYRLAP